MQEKRNSVTDHEGEAKPKVVRYILEQDNGKVRYLEGETAQKYFEQINNVLIFMQVTRRHMLPQDFLQAEWKEIDRTEAGKLFDNPTKPQTNSQGQVGK